MLAIKIYFRSSSINYVFIKVQLQYLFLVSSLKIKIIRGKYKKLFYQRRIQFKLSSWRGVLDITLCDKVCQWIATGRWISPGTPVSSTNKTDGHDITEIFLKVALNTIIINQNKEKFHHSCSFKELILKFNLIRDLCSDVEFLKKTKIHLIPVVVVYNIKFHNVVI